MAPNALPRRIVALIAFALAILGAAAVILGVFSPGEWVVVAGLVVVGVLNWRRARR